MELLVLVDGEYSASLDGITLDGELILEVKCPVNGKDSELWQQVQSVRSLYAQPRQALRVTPRREVNQCHFANANQSGGSTSSRPTDDEYASLLGLSKKALAQELHDKLNTELWRVSKRESAGRGPGTKRSYAG